MVDEDDRQMKADYTVTIQLAGKLNDEDDRQMKADYTLLLRRLLNYPMEITAKWRQTTPKVHVGKTGIGWR